MTVGTSGCGHNWREDVLPSPSMTIPLLGHLDLDSQQGETGRVTVQTPHSLGCSPF